MSDFLSTIPSEIREVQSFLSILRRTQKSSALWKKDPNAPVYLFAINKGPEHSNSDRTTNAGCWLTDRAFDHVANSVWYIFEQSKRRRTFLRYAPIYLSMDDVQTLFTHVFLSNDILDKYGKTNDSILFSSRIRHIKRCIYQSYLRNDPYGEKTMYIQQHGWSNMQQEALAELEHNPIETFGFNYKKLQEHYPRDNHVFQDLGFTASWAKQCHFLFETGIPTVQTVLFAWSWEPRHQVNLSWLARGVQYLNNKMNIPLIQGFPNETFYDDVQKCEKLELALYNRNSNSTNQFISVRHKKSKQGHVYAKHLQDALQWAIQSGIEPEVLAHGWLRHVSHSDATKMFHLWHQATSQLPQDARQRMHDYLYIFASHHELDEYALQPSRPDFEESVSPHAKVLSSFVPDHLCVNTHELSGGLELREGLDWWKRMYLEVVHNKLLHPLHIDNLDM